LKLSKPEETNQSLRNMPPKRMHNSNNSGESGDSAGASRKSASAGRSNRSSSANSEGNSNTNPNNSDGNSGSRKNTRASGNLQQQDYGSIGVPKTKKRKTNKPARKNLVGPTYDEIDAAYVTTEHYRNYPRVEGQVHIPLDKDGQPAVITNPLIDMTWKQAVRYHNDWYNMAVTKLSAKNNSFQLNKEEKKQLIRYDSGTDEDENLGKYPIPDVH
jgi:hypothetical protein